MTELPNQLELNGADYFLLQVDQLMWSSSQLRNVCTFVVTLDQRIELEWLSEWLASKPAYLWMTQLRLKQGLPFVLAKWVVDKQAVLPSIAQHCIETNTVPPTLIASAINPKKQAPFKVDLVQCANNHSLLVFSWHHVLMDAHGGESFIQYLGSGSTDIKRWVVEETRPKPLKQRADIAQEMKQFLYDTSELPLSSLYRPSVKPPILRYRVLSFSKQQSEHINQQAIKQGAGFLPSAFYLASTVCTSAKIQQQRGDVSEDMLIPVPLDRRLRGVKTPIIGNQVSFLFYRLPKHVLLNTRACTAELIQQMKQLIRSDNPSHYVIMMNFLRRIPSVFYRMMLKAPTKGLMASFFYSDTGDLLVGSEVLFNQTVTSAVHYPPNLYPSGLTFVFSRFQGQLQVTFAYMESVLTETEVVLFIEGLSEILCSAK